MSLSRLREPSKEELRARRAELLERPRMNREELQAGADAGTLHPGEFWLWRDIRAVEFLLGDDVER